MNKIVKVRYLPGAHKLSMIDIGDWCDLYTYEDVTLEKEGFAYINLGVAIQLPYEHEALIAPRSSTFKNWGLIQANSIGIIDNSFCGDDDIWMMPVYATRDVTIPKNTRLCQFRILQNQPRLMLTEVESLGNASRGGWGSTGV